MLELGREELRYHAEIGAHAGECGVDVLIAVGPLAAHMGARYGGEMYVVADAASAASLATELVRPGDTVLVKGSRGVGLEVVSTTMRAAAGT